MDDRYKRLEGKELTDRQLEIMKLVAKGFGDKEIGRILGVSRTSVQSSAYSAFVKLGAANRTEAAVIFVRKEFEADTALMRQALAALECSTDYDTSAAQARVIAALRERLGDAA